MYSACSSRQFGQLGAERFEMQPSDLLVQVLGQHVDVDCRTGRRFPKLDLRQ
jgi:hypothetical protein